MIKFLADLTPRGNFAFRSFFLCVHTQLLFSALHINKDLSSYKVPSIIALSAHSTESFTFSKSSIAKMQLH